MRYSSPGGGAPYSAALISLSVPSTPTRRSFTRTPRPSGTSLNFGFATSRRCTEFALPGMTAIAFIYILLNVQCSSCCLVLTWWGIVPGQLASPRGHRHREAIGRLLAARNRRGAQRDELHEIFGKDEIQCPAQQDADLLLYAWQLAQVDRPPEPPGDKTREVDPQDIGHPGPPADRSQQSDGREDKRLLPAATDCRRNVMGEDLPLPQGMLSGGWIVGPRPAIGDQGAIAKRPYAGPIRNLQELVAQHAAALLLARQRRQQGIGGRPCRPDQRVRLEDRAVAQLHAAIRHPRDLGVHQDLDLSFRQLALCVDAKLLAEFRQDHRPGLHQHHPKEIFAQVVIECDGFADEVVDRADRLDAGEPSAGDDERQERLANCGEAVGIGL